MENREFDRMDYEHILRSIEGLLTGEMGGRGALEGSADADWWDTFASEIYGTDVYERLHLVIIGILRGLDTIRQKIEEIDNRLRRIESS